MSDRPTFREKLIVFVLVVLGTAAAIFISTHVVNAGIGLLGRCV